MPSPTILGLDVRDQGVSRPMPSRESPGKDKFPASLPAAGVGKMFQLLGVPGLIDVSLQSLPPSPRGLLPVCLRVSVFSSSFFFFF